MNQKYPRRRLRFSAALIAIVCFLSFPIDRSVVAQSPTPTEITFGALLSLTGEWSTLGVTSKAILELAVDDVNAYLSSAGSPARVRLLVKDTKLIPAEALAGLQELAAAGARIVIGPQSSSEIRAIKPYADAQGVIVISQGSTASSLSIPGDNIFRLVPDDTLETQALTALLVADGVKAVVPIWRADAGNEGLQSSARINFQNAGRLMLEGVSYQPDTQNFQATVTALGDQVRQAVIQHGAGSVAVYLAAFDEVVSIFHLANQDPTLAAVKWYGSDGVALSAALLADMPASRFAALVGYPNPTVGLVESARVKWSPLSDLVKLKTGIYPDAFALAAYDALWVGALTSIAIGGTASPETLRAVLPRTAENYFGASGWTTLNPAGDRKFGDFDFWAIREINGIFQWVLVARYST